MGLNEVFGSNKIEQVFNSLKSLSSDWVQSDVDNTNDFFYGFFICRFKILDFTFRYFF